MNIKIRFFTMLLVSMLPRLVLGSDGEGVVVPANVPHESWDVLLKKYVNDQINYLSYNWGLNDQGDHGNDYGRNQLIWDSILNFFKFWK